MIRFVCPLIAVESIAASRAFYEGLLGQKVKFDFGQNVTFEGDFAIHEKDHFRGLLGPGAGETVMRAHNGELYFETGDVEGEHARLQAAGVEFVHGLREQPWGQRVVRLYDPDGHVVEIGETMEAVVRRFAAGGMSPAEIAARTSMPLVFVVEALGEKGP